MSEVSKPVRLSKAAREFNLGLDTIDRFPRLPGHRSRAETQHQVGAGAIRPGSANFADEKVAKEKAKQKSKTLLEMEAGRWIPKRKRRPRSKQSPHRLRLPSLRLNLSQRRSPRQNPNR